MKKLLIDAAINGKKGFEGKAYLFQGQKYSRYDWEEDKPDTAYPKDLSLWKLPGDFASGVDAAINGLFRFEGFVYLFKDSQYVKYSWEDDKPLEGYPKSLSVWNLPGNFSEGIDGACNGRGKLEGFGYLFKDHEYVKYNWEQDKPEPGYPRPLSSWKLTGDFGQGVDSVLNGEGRFANFLYFFKGDEYMRYDWNGHEVDGPWPNERYWQQTQEELDDSSEDGGEDLVMDFSDDEATQLFQQFELEGEIAFEAFSIAYEGYTKIDNGCDSEAYIIKGKKKERITYDNSTGYLIIIDFTKPSNERRMVVLNMASGTKRSHLYVSHGVGSHSKEGGKLLARNFSNTKGSNQSSLGFFVTGRAYPKDKIKKNGAIDKRVWLKLFGLEAGINDRAQRRGIMMHTADYVNEQKGRVGRSHGCPAIASDENEIVGGKLKNALFEVIKNGNLLFAYTDRDKATDPDLGTNYYDVSTLLSCIEN
ncbi:murein L,D-transpeptidase catalytic domain-containing protein [Cellulophaga baltica]|uniref:murein L,D-transpeptidase catalytic domain-containing protein n=1 Tax=Cellulophaga baltica TaxID=76594 RepID=UPI000410D84B|nr:murein L,D-transpeptidase catalytic domain family protein [Cellulophaga baltica]